MVTALDRIKLALSLIVAKRHGLEDEVTETLKQAGRDGHSIDEGIAIAIKEWDL